MQGFAKALGVECAHCHVPDHWTQPDKPTFAFTMQCFTCHQGAIKPAR
jgi:hypothetical protein